MHDRYDFRLYVAGQTPGSLAAIANLHRLCDTHLAGRHSLEIIDLSDQPHRAVSDQILALPTLERRLPKPLRRVIGDLSNTEDALRGLGIDTRRAA